MYILMQNRVNRKVRYVPLFGKYYLRIYHMVIILKLILFYMQDSLISNKNICKTIFFKATANRPTYETIFSLNKKDCI